MSEKLSTVEDNHDRVAKEFKETKEEKDHFKKDLIQIREQLSKEQMARQELEIEAADLFERLELRQIELDTKKQLLDDARVKIGDFDQIMYDLRENEKQIRFEAEIVEEKLKNSQDLNNSHKE